MKRLWAIAVIIAIALASTLAFAGMEDRFSQINLKTENYVEAPEITAPSTNPLTGWWWLYWTSNGAVLEEDDGTTLTLNPGQITFGTGGGKVTNVLMDAETAAATNALTSAECGKVFFLSATTEFATTLPAVSTVSAGCVFEFVVAAAPSEASYTIISGNSLENVINGGVTERETDTGDDGPYLADADTVTIVDGVAVVGDWLRFISDGSKYYLVGQTNADGAVTVTQAD